MRSSEVFARPAAGVRPRKPLALVTLLSTILPGTGHVLLGRATLGWSLLAMALLAIPVSVVLRSVLPVAYADLAWLIGRLAPVALIFSLIDAGFLAREPRWVRKGVPTVRPRLAAFLSGCGWGLGFIRMQEPITGWALVLFGAAAQAGLLIWLPSEASFASEIVPVALAALAYRRASEVSHVREPGDFAERTVQPVLPVPTWMVPTQSFILVLLTLTAIVAWTAQTWWLEARTIDPARQVALEPYYRHPVYGVELEMRAPGWSFRETAPDQFLDARHVSEDTRLQLRLLPRFPLGATVEGTRESLRRALTASGIQPVTIEIETVAGVDAFRLRARGTRNGKPREIAALAYESGFRRYLLHMEWAPDHATFGAGEWDYVLNGLSIEDVPLGLATTGR